jgi:hypothetical protein
LLDIHVYWNILTMHGPINVKSPNNTSKWQIGFNSAFKGLIRIHYIRKQSVIVFPTLIIVILCALALAIHRLMGQYTKIPLLK